MKHRRWWAPLLFLLPLLLAGCKKDDWGKDIESPPVNIDELRRQAQEKKAKRGQQPPANPGSAQPE